MLTLFLMLAMQVCDPAETPMRMAVEAFNNDRFAEASEIFEAIATQSPTNRYTETALRYSAYAALETGDKPAALTRFTRAMEKCPKADWFPRMAYDRAILLLPAAPERALEALGALHTADPGLKAAASAAQTRAALTLGAREQAAGRYAAAARIYALLPQNDAAAQARKQLAGRFPETNVPQIRCEGFSAGRRAVLESLATFYWPQIVARLGAEKAALPDRIVFRLSETQSAPGVTSGNVVTLGAAWHSEHPDDSGMIIHELAHVAQSYPAGVPSWLTESIADYLRYCILVPEPLPAPGPAASYTEGYRTGAWFLARLATLSESDTFIQELSQTCRRGADGVKFIEERFGKTLEALWKECFE